MLSISNLRVKHANAEVLHGLDLNVDEGEIICLIGPNGAGKTSLLLSISGIVRPDSGTMLFRGASIVGMRPAEIVRRGVVQVPQNRLVFPTMTVMENLQLGAYVREDRGTEELEFVYELFPILHERGTQLAGSLSGGEQQMLAIGRGLMAAPKLLMLDEPQLGLAPSMIEVVAKAIRVIHARGCTIVLVGQHAPMALALSSRLYVLESGLIALTGPTRELANDKRIQQAYLGVS